jgi:hypothetical protein
LERCTATPVVFSEMTVVVDPRLWERQMSNRRASKPVLRNRTPAKASKRVRRPKVAARAHRNKQAFVRSPKDISLQNSPLGSVAAGPTEAPVEVSKQEITTFENRAAALQSGFSQMMSDNVPTKGFDFSLSIANMQAYQAKLLEVTQANMRFAFEFSQRLARTRSPFEILALIAEFTGRRIVMIGKHSNELAPYWFWRLDASRTG